MSCGPASKFIVPDGRLGGAANVVSATSQAGPCTPRIIAADENFGDLIPVLEGVPDNQGYPALEFGIREPGDVTAAGFVWRQAGDDNWVGMDDGRRLVHAQPPFVFDTGVTEFDHGGECACYVPEAERLVVAVVHADDGGSGSILVRHRSIHATMDDPDWTDVVVDLDSVDGAPDLYLISQDPLQRAAMAALPDGTILLAYMYRTEFLSYTVLNVAVIRSSDYGATWKLMNPRVLSFLSELGHHLRLTVSGDWVRCDAVFGGSVSFPLLSSASRDRGTTWSEQVESDLSLNQGATEDVDPSPFAVAGVGGGRFYLAYTYGDEMTWRSGSGYGGDAYVSVGGSALQLSREAPGTIRGMGACLAHDRVYVLLSYDDGPGLSDDDQVALYYQDLSRVFSAGPGGALSPDDPDPSAWQLVEPLSAWRGVRLLPVRIHLLATGLGLHVVSGLYDTVDDEDRLATFSAQLSQYSVASLGRVAPAGDLTSTDATALLQPLFDVVWMSNLGRPAGGSSGAGGATSPDTSWTQDLGGGPTVTWSYDYLEVDTPGGAHAYWQILRPSTSSDSWLVAGSTVGGIVQVVSDSSQTSNMHGMSVISESSHSGDRVNFYVRVDPDGVSVYDAADNSVAGSVVIDLTGWSEVRVRFDERFGSATGCVWAARLDDYLNPVSDNFVLAYQTAGTTDNQLRFGAIDPGAGLSRWREVWVAKGSISDSAGFDNPTDLLGAPARADLQVVMNGLGVRWGGGAGASSDAWASEEVFAHGVENVFLDSGFVGWRSTTGDLQQLVLQAGADENDRFVHDAIALWGLEDEGVQVEYSDDPDFGTATDPEILSCLTWDALQVVDVQGATVLLEATDPDLRVPISGELQGQRLRFTSGALSGQTFAIVRHAGMVVDLALVEATTGELLPMDLTGVAAADGVLIHTTYGWLELAATRRYRYLRLTFPGDFPTATYDHRLAAILAGPLIDLPIPFEWAHTDDEQADVQLFEGSNASWGYELGAPRRTWTGRVVNDWVRWRETVRHLVRSLARYAVRPLALVIDDDDHTRVIRGRITLGEHENGVWWDDDDGTRWPVGDQAITVLEVP
jgi:hypothetical protein